MRCSASPKRSATTSAPGRILIRQKVTQSDLAAMAGIARENVSRILNDWMRAKLVSRLAGYYCLENRAALEQRSGDVRCCRKSLS